MSEAANQIFKKSKERVYRISSTAQAGVSMPSTSVNAATITPAAADFIKEATKRFNLTSQLHATSGECMTVMRKKLDCNEQC